MKFESTSLPLEMKYPKLVRDKIPAIIEGEGRIAKVEIAQNNDEFLSYLIKKVIEEGVELEHARKNGGIEEELADLYEIIDTILALQGKKKEDIIAIQTEKREKNGGFEKRLIITYASPRHQ